MGENTTEGKTTSGDGPRSMPAALESMSWRKVKGLWHTFMNLFIHVVRDGKTGAIESAGEIS